MCSRKMDSCNSGSMSSSGGDDEYDSRAESSISAFLNHNNNNNPLTHIGPMPNPPPQTDHNHHHHHSNHHHHHQQQQQTHPHSMFDPLSNYFDPLSSSSSSSRSNPNSLLNLDMVWSKNLRSDPNCTDLGSGGFIAASSSPTQQFFTNQTQRPTFNPSFQIPQLQETVPTRGPGLGSGSVSGSVSNGTTHQTNNNDNTTTTRNPKKRSRASRRAPTTVLTTDTTNFRAMVQEFTGIPAPPFTNSSHFPRTRLDLFGNSSSLRSVATHLESSNPSYLLRPFAQKIQPPFLSSSSCSMIDAIASTTSITPPTNNNTTTTTTSTSTNINTSANATSNINMQNNPILNFYSLLQQSPKYPLPNSSILGVTTKPQENPLEDFGLSHGHGNLQNLVSSSNDGDNLLRCINGDTQRVVGNNGKVINYSAASSSDFKGTTETNTRNEGIVESWICSSD